jgi:hypothetical protein
MVSPSPRQFVVAAGLLGFTLGIIVTLFVRGSRPVVTEVQPPEIGGQKAPATVREIDFTKRYDVYCTFFEKEKVFPGCKVVGFTGPEAKGHEPSGGLSLTSRSDYQHFNRWLSLELGDGRMAYIPPSALRYLETAKAP